MCAAKKENKEKSNYIPTPHENVPLAGPVQSFQVGNHAKFGM